jgi:hypothetical protein
LRIEGLAAAGEAGFGPADRLRGNGRPAGRIAAGVLHAVCKDARGQLRTLELFLPADLVAELARPLDIKFLSSSKAAGRIDPAVGRRVAHAGDRLLSKGSM